MSQVAFGKVAFSNLEEFDVYKGKSTGRYSLVVVLDDATAESLDKQGVTLKEYEGNMQRKFTSKFNVQVIDLQGEPVTGELPRGSEVRVLFTPGEPGENGTPTYMNKVRVVELAEQFDDGDIPDEF